MNPSLTGFRRIIRSKCWRSVCDCWLILLLGSLVAWLTWRSLGLGKVPAVVIGCSLSGVCGFAWMHLRGAPREVGLTFALKLLSVCAYKVLNITLLLWLSNDLGFSKEKALGLIAGWSLAMTLVTLVAGSVTDVLGLRRTLLTGVAVCIGCRFLMIVSSNPWLALAGGLLPLALGEALCTPVLVAALRRYTTPSQRSVAFSLFYAVMNFGFMLANFLFDGVREVMVTERGLVIPGLGMLGQYRVLLLVSLALEICMIPLVLFMRSEVHGAGADVSEHAEIRKSHGRRRLGELRTAIQNAVCEALGLFRRLVEHADFYRLLLFLMLIGLLKVVFNVMDYVLPTFVLQELGQNAKVGRFNAINGMLILVLAPAIGVLTRRYSAYSMVVVGGLLTAGSFGFMMAPTMWFQPLADGWLGTLIGRGYMELAGSVHPYYLMIVFWQVVFSIGEAFYSPRVYEYAAAIAPKGQEASYASLSYVPLLIGKLVTGAAFGGLLERYCPESGDRNPQMMWTVIGLMVLVAPLGLLLLRRWIRVQEEGRSLPQ